MKDDQAVVLMAHEKFIQAIKYGVARSMKPVLNVARRNSIFPLHMGLMCCAVEMASVMGPRFDIERIGVLARASPRQCDLIWVNGPVTKKMAPRIKKLYDQMPNPKWAIATGECAISGGPWHESYAVLRGADQVIPVDVYVPGCPPRPESMWMGIELLKKVITFEKQHGFKPNLHAKDRVASEISMQRWKKSVDGFYPWWDKKDKTKQFEEELTKYIR
ncbi:MAG: NADH-quinone oxidoreductase subunit B [Candidatus Heimdallarchaeota archaeon]